ncbi:MAG: DUF1192 domain-containing protein [Pseudomonadota bacterium]
MASDDDVAKTTQALLREALAVDLDAYSIEDLEDRIGVLKAEIARCEALMARKGEMRAAADSVFKF